MGLDPPPPVHMRPPEPDPLLPPCGRHKWMAPYMEFILHVYEVRSPMHAQLHTSANAPLELEGSTALVNTYHILCMPQDQTSIIKKLPHPTSQSVRPKLIINIPPKAQNGSRSPVTAI